MADMKLTDPGISDGDALITTSSLVYVVQGGLQYRATVGALLALMGATGADLSYTATPTNGTVVSSSGADATIPAADGTNAGLMLPTQVTKLAGVDNRANHTGTQTASTISDLAEAVDDRVAALLAAGTGVSLTYDDTAGVLTIAAKTPAPVTVTYAASTTIDVTGQPDGRIHRITLTGDLTIGFTGGVDGQKVLVELIQDATGSRTVTLGASVAFGTDISAFVATTTPSKKDVLGFIYSSAAAKYMLVAVAKGY